EAGELDALVESAVCDEIAWREGVALGLDRDDPVIERRVRQKLEVVAEEMLERPAPGDRELAAWLEAHPDRFRRPGTVTFEQVLVAPGDGRGVDVGRRVADVRAAIARGEPAESLSENTLLPRRGD
ncbi:MAG: peptidyl-prolyl cis-trans isomerase, partial [Alphaproteobacteria bacterium]